MTSQICDPIIACTLGAGDFRSRLDGIATLNRSALRDIHRDDLRLELVYAGTARAQVLDLVRQEQQCCAFLTFEVHDEADAVRVLITAPEAARDSVEAVFAPFEAAKPATASCGCCGAAA